MLEIREVSNKKQLRLFAKYPIRLYKGCPYYVPSLRSDEMNTFNPKKNFNIKNNPVKGFLCYKDGELVGRIAGLVSKEENSKSEEKFVRFSRFECVDDEEVFKALLGAVEKFGKEKESHQSEKKESNIDELRKTIEQHKREVLERRQEMQERENKEKMREQIKEKIKENKAMLMQAHSSRER